MHVIMPLSAKKAKGAFTKFYSLAAESLTADQLTYSWKAKGVKNIQRLSPNLVLLLYFRVSQVAFRDIKLFSGGSVHLLYG